jgi:hypothetical protein
MSSTGKRDQNDYDGKDNDNNHDGDHIEQLTYLLFLKMIEEKLETLLE